MSTSSLSKSKRKRVDENVSQPTRKIRRVSSDAEASGSERGENDENTSAVKVTKKHTKKDRKQNRSSRIHSIRKQLARGGLPSTIQQEKERELAALLHDQSAEKDKKQAKKVLEKYHYVRFVERQKAEKRLKQLRKQLHASNDEHEDLRTRIQEMEVNRNYAIYAPLNEKYVSVFTSGNGNADGSQQDSSLKPSTWYLVEKLMAEGQSRLEALRAGKLRASTTLHDQDELRPSDVKTTMKSSKRRSDSKENKDRLVGRVTTSQDEVGDLDDSDARDGGFFEM